MRNKDEQKGKYEKCRDKLVDIIGKERSPTGKEVVLIVADFKQENSIEVQEIEDDSCNSDGKFILR